jgi:hypothetical protein
MAEAWRRAVEMAEARDDPGRNGDEPPIAVSMVGGLL